MWFGFRAPWRVLAAGGLPVSLQLRWWSPVVKQRGLNRPFRRPKTTQRLNDP
jgi:hypothetical protein